MKKTLVALAGILAFSSGVCWAESEVCVEIKQAMEAKNTLHVLGGVLANIEVRVKGRVVERNMVIVSTSLIGGSHACTYGGQTAEITVTAR